MKVTFFFPLPSCTKCPLEFRNRCSCGRFTIKAPDGKAYQRFVTNCTNGGFSDANVLRALPVETQILIFTGNNLAELPQNLFGNDGQKQYVDLKVINLSNNKISAIHGKTFHNVRNVTKLILDHNELLITGQHFHSRIFSNFGNLEELHLRDAFGERKRNLNFMVDLVTILTEANLNKLKVLRLDNNSINSIPNPEVFCSLPSLQYLHLSNNYLTDAKVNTSCFRRPRLLDVSDNFIANLSNETLSFYETAPGSLFHVNLTRNPFHCDCELRPFFNWLNRTRTWVLGNKSFYCTSGYPERNTGKPFTSIRASDLQCQPQALEDELRGYITASYAVLISLSVALVILVGALVYSNREHLSKGWTTLSNSFAAKSEYTSLQQDSKRVQQVQMGGGEVDEVTV